MKKAKRTKPAVKPYDELDAVREISGILEGFDSRSRVQILRWVREKLDMETEPQIEAPQSPIIQPGRPARKLKNPHEMAKPPLGKLILQDDDDDGDLLFLPKDNDLPEPEGIDQIKPKGPARRLVKKIDYDKHGNPISESLVLAK